MENFKSFITEQKDEKYKVVVISANSDEKGITTKRIEAFLKLGRKDPVEYVDGWDITKAHVEELLANY